MSLQNLLELSFNYETKKRGLSEERIDAQLDHIRPLIAFFREYPDLFVDFIKGENCKFQFYFYQRIILRAIVRHRYCYATFPRAASKSFLTMMGLIIRAVLYPGAELFVTTGGKEQAASITIAKIEEICKLIPALSNEINWARGQSKKSKDDVEYKFKNGSKINILPAKETSRGQRRTGGAMEECVLIDQTALNEIVIPTTNVDRLLKDGTRHKEETVNKSQVYITTAGYKDSFAYAKLIELLIQSIIEPDSAMILGGTYEIPVKEGLLDEDFVDQLKVQDTFNEDSFDREYCSKWCGSAENAFFSAEKFDKYRTLLQPEYEINGRGGKNSYYVIAVDVGRIDCTTEACVFRVNPQPQGAALKTLVNIVSIKAEHFETQAIDLKRLYFKYKPLKMAIDANGLGIGLIDYMVKSQVDPETGDFLPPFGVDNDDDGKYKQFKTTETLPNIMFLIKANAPLNTEAYSYAQTQLMNGKIRFLIDEVAAKTKVMQTKLGQNMTLDQRAEYLKPYILTTILKEEMMNLIEDNEGINIILKRSSKSIKKDKFSAFIYGLYYIKKEEERRRKHKKFSLADMMFFG